jgi:hypothetical protein
MAGSTSAFASAAYRFRVNQGAVIVDCIVTDDAVQALGASNNELSVTHRRFLEGIATERLEWSPRPLSTIVIDAWDIETHRQD